MVDYNMDQDTLDEKHKGRTALKPAAVLLQVVETLDFPFSVAEPLSLLKAKLARPDASDNLKPLIDEFVRLVEDVFCSGTIEDIFLGILESLVFPPKFSERAQQLKEELSRGLSATAIKNMTESVVTLMADMRSVQEHEKEGLEIFLQQLTQHLIDLDAMVEGTESQHFASQTGGRQLDAMIKAEVGDIENAVMSAVEISQMKRAIQGSLEKIHLHLVERSELEEQRQELLERQLRSLTKKLKQMEGESHQLRLRLVKELGQALIDPLTGVHNHLAFDQRAAQEFARWQRYKHPLTLMVCDVDHFKKINDTYGHKAGDRALVAIVKTIQFHLRETDFLARIGDKEFAVLLAETSAEDAKTVAEKLRMSVEESEFFYQGNPVPITISGGFSQFQPGDTVEAVHQRANLALNRAKHDGRNQFVVAIS